MSFKYTIGTLEHNTPCKGFPGGDDNGRASRWWANIANIAGWDNYDWWFVGAFANGVRTLDLDVVICPKGEWDYAELLTVLTSAQQYGLEEDIMLDIYAAPQVCDPEGPAADFFYITNHQGWSWESNGKVITDHQFAAENVENPIAGLWKWSWNTPSKSNIFPRLWVKLEDGTYTKLKESCADYIQQ